MIEWPDWAAKLCHTQSDSYSGVHATGAQASIAVSRPVSIQIERKRQYLRLTKTLPGCLQNYHWLCLFVCLSVLLLQRIVVRVDASAPLEYGKLGTSCNE